MFTIYCSLFTVLMGCGINKDIYQKTVEESEARKAGLAEAQKQITALQDENQQLKSKTDELAKQAADADAVTKEREELASKNEYMNRELERLKVKAGELSAEKEKELAGVKNTYEKLISEMEQEIKKGDIKITQAVDRLSVNMVEKILFDSGKAEIKPEGLKVLDRVGAILKGITDKQIRIEGHTDNVKIGSKIKEKYPTNWELSTARATSVVRYLQDKVGIDPRHLSAIGYSEYKPIAGNDTTEGRALNRRMEIVLLPLDLGSVVEELKKK
ncbi:MAG: hypothetical protein A3G39_10950 [Deltaproteobacteria bacterium RIFCSPLOWO2_12_FULL_43_16]|nr:MAG: hypothetical protein A2Z89_09045 [Deltaproteobacteria bacterium GWA2_43_19]OGQ13147.1 MAG: hypothetical protein A3D30_09930 [Deltaproteobacteria bacterium RIFCSPHIGHO2_02_FULL_43_33]OGQ33405.1 MAG: hypothetical protein A3A85_01675 [Deltaproteobacteria bacterium RIFCSPLOWO2_01_FULL_42_9]OGQ57420.1 MAG: hypothetical protein A3G39_10950 [Deltaproteobacteria bacterium RIFCSPLOWO2_12_FULL_43_16]HBR16966.1 chemotaxis protein MotB [Deltaproteobacteria bacterium]